MNRAPLGNSTLGARARRVVRGHRRAWMLALGVALALGACASVAFAQASKQTSRPRKAASGARSSVPAPPPASSAPAPDFAATPSEDAVAPEASPDAPPSKTASSTPGTSRTASGKTSTRGAKTPSRRLSDIHIEGEAAAPQVLFISPQDPRRVTDFQHQRYLPTSRAIGELGSARGIAVVDPSRDRSKRSTP